MEFDGAAESLSGYNQGIEHEHEQTLGLADTALCPPRLNLPAYPLDIRCCTVFLYWLGS